MLEHREPQVQLDVTVSMEGKEYEETEAAWDFLASQVLQEASDQWEMLDPRVMMDHKEPQEKRESRVLEERLVTLDVLENQELLVYLENPD